MTIFSLSRNASNDNRDNDWSDEAGNDKSRIKKTHCSMHIRHDFNTCFLMPGCALHLCTAFNAMNMSLLSLHKPNCIIPSERNIAPVNGFAKPAASLQFSSYNDVRFDRGRRILWMTKLLRWARVGRWPRCHISDVSDKEIHFFLVYWQYLFPFDWDLRHRMREKRSKRTVLLKII